MRVYTSRKTIVDLKHFRYCAKHYGMLLTLQQETPNLMLEVNDLERRSFIPIHQLDLEESCLLHARAGALAGRHFTQAEVAEFPVRGGVEIEPGANVGHGRALPAAVSALAHP